MSQKRDARDHATAAVASDAQTSQPTNRANIAAPEKLAPSTERIIELDVLRGFAALAVVLYHYTTRYEECFGHHIPLPVSVPWGKYGVEFFFILSGLMILRSLDRLSTALHFGASRFARLYPAYWTAAAATFMAVSIWGLPGQEVTVRDALLNATMVQRLFGARHIDGAYWSLQFELIFYAGAWACYRAGVFRTEQRLHFSIACWLAASAAYQLTPIGAVTDNTLLAKAISKTANLASLRYAHLFGLGILIYQAEKSRRTGRIFWLLAASCCVVQGLVDCWPAAAFVAAAGLTIFAASHSRLGWLRIPVFMLLGAISYSLYLIHENIGFIVIHEIECRGIASLLAVVGAITVSVLLAAGLTFAVERPSQRWIKARLRSAVRPE